MSDYEPGEEQPHVEAVGNEKGSQPHTSEAAPKCNTWIIVGLVLLVALLVVAIAVPLSLQSNDSNEKGSNAAAGGSAQVTAPPTDAPSKLRGGDATTSPSASGPTSIPRWVSNNEEMTRFLSDPDFFDKEFFMVNIYSYYDIANYPDGRDSNLTGYEANQIYTSVALSKIIAMGAQPVFDADIEWDMGRDTPYEKIVIVRYPNTTAFRGMTQDPEFQANLIHKEAGLAHNFVMACEALEVPYLPPLENPPFPATPDNPETAMININDYREFAQYQPGDPDADNTRTGREAYDLYTSNGGTVVVNAYGVRNIASFNVKAVVIGDLGFETIRINWFPSDKAWQEVIADPIRQSFTHHRYAGIEDHSKSFKVMPINSNNLYNLAAGDSGSGGSCDICGTPGAVMANEGGVVDLPDGSDQDTIQCSQLEFAAKTGLIPAAECQTLSPVVMVPCGCTTDTIDMPAPSPTAESSGEQQCNVCGEGSSVQSPDTVLDLPTGETATCGQLEFAAETGLLLAGSCPSISSLVAANCECG